MSSENRNVNLNEQPEVQTDTNVFPAGENCDIEEKNVKEEIVVISETDGKIENLDSDNADLIIKEENITNDLQNNVKEATSFPTPLGTEGDDTKCDICSSVDVENITNSLAEKVNIENEPEVKETECDIKVTDANSEKNKPLTPEKLINKVNKMNISEVVLQGTSNNESAVILKQETDSLKNLLVYESSSDDEAESEQNWQLRTIDKSESESDSDDSESSDEDDDEDDDDEDDDDTG